MSQQLRAWWCSGAVIVDRFLMVDVRSIVIVVLHLLLMDSKEVRRPFCPLFTVVPDLPRAVALFT